MALVYSLQRALELGVMGGACLAFGVFDGVHLGHACILDAAISQARAKSTSSVVLTFDVDPDDVIRPGAVKKIMSDERRIGSLSQTGVDAVVLLPFNNDFAKLSPDDFLKKVFGGHVPLALNVGLDFRFGYKGQGTVDTLLQWGQANGTEVVVHELECSGGAPITATRIRGLLAEGNVEEAAKLLGRLYSIEGRVLRGRQEGREMGFSTANLNIEPSLRVLGAGVYGGYAVVRDTTYKAAISVGVSPTFQDASAVCEVHILDFEGDIYDTEIEVFFAAWLRPMRKFDDVDELITTVMGNIEWCRNNL